MAMPDVSDEFPVELRCSGTLHGVLKVHHGQRCLESKCHQFHCTKGRAVAVFHYYSLETGELVDTVTYQDPGRKFRNA